MFKRKVVNVVYLTGIIKNQGKKSLSLENIKDRIDKAFSCGKNIKAVVIIINSPGGSAAQSEIIANYIKQKQVETNIGVISLIEDVAASGGYFIACAANEIHALSKSSIVGSIGVLFSGFGLNKFIEKYGIERRVYTAGKNKVMLDSFGTEKPEDVEFLKNILQETHEHFKCWVKTNRQNKLEGISEEDLFSGKFWLASTAKNYGIIDGIIEDTDTFLKQRFGKKIKINYIKSKKSFLSSLFLKKLNFEISSEDIANDLEDKLLNKSLDYKL